MSQKRDMGHPLYFTATHTLSNMPSEDLIIIDVDDERTVIWKPQVHDDDLLKVACLLKQEQIFVPTFIEDPYEASLYIQQEGFHGTHSLLFLDTNILTRVIELAKGAEAKEEHRIPAAVMCFAACARLLALPAAGLYEEALSRPGRDSNLDLAYFHASDNISPQLWCDIALGRKRTLRLQPKLAKFTRHNFAKPLAGFGFTYPLVLKLALIELQGGSRQDKFRQFLDWQFKYWLFSASANLLAVRLFSSTPPRKALKSIRSKDRTVAQAGIKNAANDLAFANAYFDFYKKTNAKNELTVFCSRDKLLREIVEDLRKAFNGVDVLSERIHSSLGEATLGYYRRLNGALDSQERLFQKGSNYNHLIVESLESNFMAWSPR